MATRTFLQLINDVLVELRETEVTTNAESDYSILIGRFVNRAKRAVENAWRWHALRDTFTVTTEDGTVTYAFTGTDERAQVLDAWNYTGGWELRQRTIRSMNEVYFAAGGAGVQTGEARDWIPNGVDANGQTQIDIYPVPTAATAGEVLRFTVYAPENAWSDDADTCIIPYESIVLTAVAIAKGERGEDGGIASSEVAGFALAAAGDSIAIDATKHDDDIEWEAV